MDYRRANRTYLYMILSTLGLVLAMSLWYANGGPTVSILANNILSEGVVLIPALAAVFYSGEKLSVMIPFHKIRIKTVLLVILYVIMLFPMVTFVNAVSMIFVENTVSAISGDVLKMPMWVMILSIGILGPLVEEIVFRGVILQSYQRTGRIVGSILLSSVLFGMMHMNFNQFAYGAVMGIMLALLYEATGTITASFLAHATFNTIEVVMMYANNSALDEAATIAENYIGASGLDTIYYVYLFVAAAIFTVGAILILRLIATIEDRIEFLESIPGRSRFGLELITLPLIIAMVISISYMYLYTLL